MKMDPRTVLRRFERYTACYRKKDEHDWTCTQHRKHADCVNLEYKLMETNQAIYVTKIYATYTFVPRWIWEMWIRRDLVPPIEFV